jgi:hypothetical protein
VHWSEVASANDKHKLHRLLADRTPLFYREPDHIIERIKEGYCTTAFREALLKLPTIESFQESHLGEIAACLFAEDVLGMTRLYSKLSFLSAQNTNAYKMDLVLCDFSSNSPEFVFCEVKTSTKSSEGTEEPFHENSCFANIFRSLMKYEDDDVEFDLTAIGEHLNSVPPEHQKAVREALRPYASRVVRYAAFAIIDTSTRRDGEMRMLATRSSKTPFNVDVICIETLPVVVKSTWKYLNGLRAAHNAD